MGAERATAFARDMAARAVSGVQLVLASALAVAAWRVARERAEPLRDSPALA
jgi:hypothetical protein